jgi:hypothetical protein
MVRKSSALPYNDENINLFIARFSTGAYALQNELDKATGKATWCPATERAHISYDKAKAHMDGEVTLGSYCITQQNECKYLVIDFDVEATIASEVFAKNDRKSKERLEEAKGKLRDEIKVVIEALQEKLQIERSAILLEDSGSKGYHLWMLFDQPYLAMDVHKVGRVIANELGLQKREIFPKQGSISGTSLGSLIKLPLGIHRKTGERCLFLDDEFKPIMDQWAALSGATFIGDAHLKNILKLKDTEVERIEEDEVDDVTKFGGSIERMIDRCEALQIIKQKSEFPDPSTGVINLRHDERLFLVSALKKFGEIGRARLHQFTQNTHNYNQDMTDKAFNSSNMKPMCCDTLIDRGVCSRSKDKKCESINDCGGKSPIKLAIDAKFRTGSEVTVLNSLSEIENPLLRGRRIRADFVVTAMTDLPYGAPKKTVFDACKDTTCPKHKECKCMERDEHRH